MRILIFKFQQNGTIKKEFDFFDEGGGLGEGGGRALGMQGSPQSTRAPIHHF